MMYYVDGAAVSKDLGMRLWKTRYKTYDNFYEKVILTKTLHPQVVNFAETVKNEWNSCEEITIEEVQDEKSYNTRRLMNYILSGE
jgi:hypothetical protein